MFQSLYIIERDKDFELLIMGKEDFVQNDFLLIRKMKQGDDDALDLFVHKYYQDILNYCHYHCSDKTYAEDLAQETFVHFFSKLSDYHYRGKTLNYLYTIASNLCKDYLKKIKEIPLEENEIVEENQMENILNKILVEQALKQLPVELCEVLTLYGRLVSITAKHINIYTDFGISDRFFCVWNIFRRISDKSGFHFLFNQIRKK